MWTGLHSNPGLMIARYTILKLERRRREMFLKAGRKEKYRAGFLGRSVILVEITPVSCDPAGREPGNKCLNFLLFIPLISCLASRNQTNQKLECNGRPINVVTKDRVERDREQICKGKRNVSSTDPLCKAYLCAGNMKEWSCFHSGGSCSQGRI